jgi:hypothetical protein
MHGLNLAPGMSRNGIQPTPFEGLEENLRAAMADVTRESSDLTVVALACMVLPVSQLVAVELDCPGDSPCARLLVMNPWTLWANCELGNSRIGWPVAGLSIAETPFLPLRVVGGLRDVRGGQGRIRTTEG